jgi:hypothetical protein
MKNNFRKLDPNIGQAYSALLDFCKKTIRKVSKCEEEKFADYLNDLQNNVAKSLSNTPDTAELNLALIKSIIIDLITIGWRLKIKKNEIYIAPPNSNSATPSELKETIRKGHLIERDAQLRKKSVQKFVKKMERRRLSECGWHSIFSMMRDGKELAENLSKISILKNGESYDKKLAETINPYIQLVTEGQRCKFTGLFLSDIWRYFRHTWINAYKPTPGRYMRILIRDASTPNNTIIGIAALGSSVVQQRLRDRWIGWDPDVFLKELKENPSLKYARWLLKTLNRQINSIYVDDLMADRICQKVDIDKPTSNVIKRLFNESEKAIQQHRLFPNAANTKKIQTNNKNRIDWERQAKTPLFRSKRCRTLAKLLKIRLAFQNSGLIIGKKKELTDALEQSIFIYAVRHLVRFVKAEHVGINIMDLIVCGAIAPYNNILGGKLICMLLCSPEIVKLYAQRYNQTESIIASSMKGKPIVRKPRLVLLSTTSLYGVGSSQYNRVRIPCGYIGGDPDEAIVYTNVGKSKGFGSYHFSEVTLKLVDAILARNKDGRRVNSIFGEGVNPKLRKIREAFDLLGLPTEEFLIHGNQRIVYTIPLIKNYREVLLSLSVKPQYLIPQSNAKARTDMISDYWRTRWLGARIKRQEVLDAVRKNTLSYPITHRAKVSLAKAKNKQLSLFHY